MIVMTKPDGRIADRPTRPHTLYRAVADNNAFWTAGRNSDPRHDGHDLDETPATLTIRWFHRRRRALCAVRGLAERSHQERAERSERHGARPRRCRWPAGRAHGADEGLRYRWFRLLQPHRQPEGPRTRRKS